MRHISDIETIRLGAAPDNQEFELSKAIRTSAVVEEFRSIGYTIAATETPTSALGLAQADLFFENAGLDGVEIHLIDGTSAGRVIQFLAPGLLESALRRHMADAFRAIETVSEDQRPTFMLAHVWNPHAPSIFLNDGSPAPIRACRPECAFFEISAEATGLTADEFVTTQWGQIQHLNDLLVAAIDRVLASSGPSPIIVVMSDHGMRFDANNRPEWLRNFFAVRTPGHPNLFGPKPTPVNLFGSILQTYFGHPHDVQPDSHFLTPSIFRPLEFTPFQYTNPE